MPEKIKDIRDSINNSKINVNFEDNLEYSNIEINIENLDLKSYQRNRSSKIGHNYDPLSSYKSIFKSKLDPLIKNYIEFPYEGYCYINIEKYLKLPKNSTKLEIKLANEKLFLPSKKPDNDNIEKIIFDILNNLVYKDDSQIVENNTKKYYSEEPKTIIRIKIYKKEFNTKKRRNKKK